MAIVKYRNQSGILYAYDQISEWDPVRKQSRSKRTLLGRVDEETGEIIKTTKKRKSKSKDGGTEQKTQSDFEALYKDAATRIRELEKSLEEISSRNILLEEENRKAKKLLEEIHKMTGNGLGSPSKGI